MARCALDIICGIISIKLCKINVLIIYVTDAAMGTKVHAQTVKSDYAKAVYKYL